jgi:pimeloyl-ACP methyl ester carboxylesterase
MWNMVEGGHEPLPTALFERETRRPMNFRIFLLFIISAFADSHAHARDFTSGRTQAVKEIADSRLDLGRSGVLPIFVSRDWSIPSPGVTRAVVIVHGLRRNAYNYFRAAETARSAAGQTEQSTIVIAPQFLNETDAAAHDLPAKVLRWSGGSWEGGLPAKGPSAASSFDALDGIFETLANPKLFPDLKVVVIAGHSGGGQIVQRYAIAGKAEADLTRREISVRYVVANPSSYAYFDSQRPEPAIAASCRGFNKWKYGLEARPPYLAAANPKDLEHRYVTREVIYLLGTFDDDPNHPELEKSCAAEAEGPTRYSRGHEYARLMARRNSGTPKHKVWDVPGVGHEGPKMINSPCGLQALFDVPGCTTSR